jgi:hypothetical protein
VPQLSLDRFLAGPGDARARRTATGVTTTVGVLGDAEPLLALPALAFPATIEVTRVVAANATVAFRGNGYSVPPGLTDVDVSLRHRLARRPSRSTRPSAACWPHTASRRPVLGASCAALSITAPSSVS